MEQRHISLTGMPKNIAQSKRVTSTALMDVWFDCGGTAYVSEEVVGLGPSYALTLTVLVAEPPPDPAMKRKKAKRTIWKTCCPPTAGASLAKIEQQMHRSLACVGSGARPTTRRLKRSLWFLIQKQLSEHFLELPAFRLTFAQHDPANWCPIPNRV